MYSGCFPRLQPSFLHSNHLSKSRLCPSPHIPTSNDDGPFSDMCVWRPISSLRYTDDTTVIAENEEELKSVLMKMKEECEKAGLKLNVQKTKIMASTPINSWQIDG